MSQRFLFDAARRAQGEKRRFPSRRDPNATERKARQKRRVLHAAGAEPPGATRSAL